MFYMLSMRSETKIIDKVDEVVKILVVWCSVSVHLTDQYPPALIDLTSTRNQRMDCKECQGNRPVCLPPCTWNMHVRLWLLLYSDGRCPAMVVTCTWIFELTMRSSSGNKEVSEDKVKTPAQKGPVLQKGRFSVTSDDTDFEVISCRYWLLKYREEEYTTKELYCLGHLKSTFCILLKALVLAAF